MLKKILYLILVHFVVFSNFCYAKTILKVFHAGSLAVPFSKMEAAFEKNILTLMLDVNQVEVLRL